jgi:histidinol-phosphate aminotransferase
MPRFSRRSFLQLSAAASVASVFHARGEAQMAAKARPAVHAANAVFIDANENPLGPCASARDAVAAMIPQSGRYLFDLTADLAKTFAEMEGLNPEWVRATVGSTPGLALTVLAFTSPGKSYVTADPGYEYPMMTAAANGVRVVKVPLTASYAHDVKAMLSAAPDAGLFYICTPNNPTGTLTPHSDVEYLLANKPKASIVLVDEAYIHFCDAASVLDLVKAGKDVVLLRTFSKIYGMAGLRCGFVIARPDLMKEVMRRGGWNPMPVMAVVAAKASLKDPQLVPERRRINTSIRQQTFEWLDYNGYTYIPSQSNCFMLNTKRPGKDVREAMAKEGVMIGRIWPIMPNWVRITVGTREEMDKFQTALQQVMKT